MLANWYSHKPWLEWRWHHYVIVICALCFTIFQIYERHRERMTPLAVESIETIEQDIQEFNTMAEQLGQLEVLPPVRDQWAYALAVTDNYLVRLKPLSLRGKLGYQGPLAAWTGVLQGPTGQVLAAAKKIQETVPTYLYEINVNSRTSEITLSVLGSE